jgi:hypothetical protein
MATATLALMIFSAGVSVVQMFDIHGPGGAIGAICYGGCAWWLYFDSGLFG